MDRKGDKSSGRISFVKQRSRNHVDLVTQELQLGLLVQTRAANTLPRTGKTDVKYIHPDKSVMLAQYVVCIILCSVDYIYSPVALACKTKFPV